MRIDENRLKRIIKEAVDEINASKPSWFDKATGLQPGFNLQNPRHAKAYDSLRDWYHWIQNTYKLRDDVILNLFDSARDDIKYGEF